MTLPLFYKKLIGLIRYNYKITNIRTPFGEPFNSNNHWVKTLQEYDAGLRDYKKSSLYKFHKNFKPRTIFDVMDLEQENLDKLMLTYPLGNYPWSRWVQPLSKERWLNTRHCGPSDDLVIENEWNEFIILYESIKSEGLRVKKYGHPIGLLFVDDNNTAYYIVLGGNHRTAVAAHLGVDFMPARLFARDFIDKQIIYYSDIELLDNEDIEISKKLFLTLVSDNFINWEEEI